MTSSQLTIQNTNISIIKIMLIFGQKMNFEK